MRERQIDPAGVRKPKVPIADKKQFTISPPGNVSPPFSMAPVSWKTFMNPPRIKRNKMISTASIIPFKAAWRISIAPCEFWGINREGPANANGLSDRTGRDFFRRNKNKKAGGRRFIKRQVKGPNRYYIWSHYWSKKACCIFLQVPTRLHLPLLQSRSSIWSREKVVFFF